MKKLSILFAVILVFSLLSACNFSEQPSQTEQPGKADWEEIRKEKFITCYMTRDSGASVFHPSRWCEYGGNWCWLAYGDGYDFLLNDYGSDNFPCSVTVKGYNFESDHIFKLSVFKNGEITQLISNSETQVSYLGLSDETIKTVLKAFNTHMHSHNTPKEAPVVNAPASTDIPSPTWDDTAKTLFESLWEGVYGTENMEPNHWCNGSDHSKICYLTSGDGYHIVLKRIIAEIYIDDPNTCTIGAYTFDVSGCDGIYAFKEGRLVHLSYLYRLGEVSEATVKAAWEAFLDHGGLEGI